MVWGQGPPNDNLESWQDIQHFIAEHPDDHYWSAWKQMVRTVVSALDKRGLAPLFRIGQSMHHVLFSTLEHHRLDAEPRVTLEFHPGENLVRIAYSHANLYFFEPLAEERVVASAAAKTTIKYLRRLWMETKPTSEVPEELTLA